MAQYTTGKGQSGFCRPEIFKLLYNVTYYYQFSKLMKYYVEWVLPNSLINIAKLEQAAKSELFAQLSSE